MTEVTIHLLWYSLAGFPGLKLDKSSYHPRGNVLTRCLAVPPHLAWITLLEYRKEDPSLLSDPLSFCYFEVLRGPLRP